MSENELIPAGLVADVPMAYSADAIEAAVKGVSWLPRIQLMTAKSGKVMAGEFPADCYALIQDQKFTNLGQTVDVLICSYRPRATEFGDESVITIFDPKPKDGKATGEFLRIQLKSEGTDSGCMFGIEFLLWIPSVSEFASLFMGSASNRRESPFLTAKVRKAATLASKFIKTQKYSWRTIDVKDCSVIEPMPDTAKLIAEIDKFNNPKESVVEAVDEAGATSDRDR